MLEQLQSDSYRQLNLYTEVVNDTMSDFSIGDEDFIDNDSKRSLNEVQPMINLDNPDESARENSQLMD